MNYSANVDEIYWQSEDNTKCGRDGVGNGHNCAGSVADNGWKAIYK